MYIHEKYKSSRTHCSEVISKVKVFKKWVNLKGQGHSVKNNETTERSYDKEYSCELFFSRALSIPFELLKRI